jgi:hypothetical protein
MVTMEGKVWLATLVAEQVCELDDELVAATMRPPTSPPITSTTAPPTNHHHLGRRPLVGVSVGGDVSVAISPPRNPVRCRGDSD